MKRLTCLGPNLSVGLLSLCLGLILFAGCKPPGEHKKPDEAKDKKKQKVQAVPVEVAPLELGTIESVIKTSNYLEAEDTVQVMARTANFVKTLHVEEGDKVKKGQVLLELIDTEQRLSLKKALNQLQKAKDDYARQEKLFKDELISEKEYSESRYNLEQLDIAAQEAQREVDYTTVEAPISGTITSRLTKIGDQVTNGKHIFDIVDFNSIVTRVYIPEKHLPKLSIGLRARVFSASLSDQQYEAEIIRISPIVEARTGTVKVTLGFKDAGLLRPGMYVDAELVTEVRKDVILIPKRAIVHDNDQTFVFRLKEDRTVSKVLLKTEIADRDFVLPESGFEAGEEIVITGQNGLKDGSKVRLPGDPEESEKDENEDSTEEDKDEPKPEDSETSESGA